MFMAAAKALADLSPARHDKNATAAAAGDRAAQGRARRRRGRGEAGAADGVAEPYDDETLQACIRALVWEPVYRPYRRKRLAFRPASLRDDD